MTRGQMHRMVILLLAITAPVAAACGTRPSVARAVPAIPPDSMPAYLYDDSLMAEQNGSRYSVAVLAVAFDRDVPRAERARVIESVFGEVVGGVLFGRDGYYLVRIPHGDTHAEVDSAIAVLDATPGVSSAIGISDLEPIIPGSG